MPVQIDVVDEATPDNETHTDWRGWQRRLIPKLSDGAYEPSQETEDRLEQIRRAWREAELQGR